MWVNAHKQPPSIFFSLSVGMTLSWHDLVGISFIVFSNWFWVIVLKFFSFGVSLSFGSYAGKLVNPSLILPIFFGEKSVKSSAS